MKDALDLKIKKVAHNIRKIREYRNYTQEYLAAKLRISQNAYSKIELGHTKITIDRLFRIADILGVDPVIILNIDDSEILSIVKSNSA
ncbi:MAG TPA: helix-turn-helix transcriptional regulator [Mucilaginibacter sp.]|jgi:transcriptional regulator with XRE-family HTH domain|nr:helix-turn-helix transcriptional regulator [Mucilaginibacter sp.]